MTRTHSETAKLISDHFDKTSKDWGDDRYEYSNQTVTAPGKQYIDGLVSRMSAAVGGGDEIRHAVAGVTHDGDGLAKKFEVAVLTDQHLHHSAFAVEANGRVEVRVVPRSSLVSLTVTDAAPYNQTDIPARMKFTATYKDGLTVKFPLMNNRADDMSWLPNLLQALKSDLSS